jgi:hypothetical protein
VQRRAELGIDTSADAPLLVSPDGCPIPPEQADLVLRLGRLTATSIEGNAAFCRDLLATRYASASKEGER